MVALGCQTYLMMACHNWLINIAVNYIYNKAWGLETHIAAYHFFWRRQPCDNVSIWRGIQITKAKELSPFLINVWCVYKWYRALNLVLSSDALHDYKLPTVFDTSVEQRYSTKKFK